MADQDPISESKDNQGDLPMGPGPEQIDSQLQQELDEALGDMSIEELMEADEVAHAATSQPPAAEGVRRGVVTAIHGDDIFVDFGGKSQGYLASSQFDDEPLPEIGSPVEVTIEGYNRQDGLLILSRKGAVLAATWETLDEGQIVEGRVTGHNKGGLELTINGIRAFMPISQIELFRVDELDDYDNQRLRCQVTEVDRAEENVIVSRRNLLELEAEEKREALWETLAEGQTVAGTVRSIVPYGAFVDIGGIDGLLHISDMSHTRVEDPASIVQVGGQVQVKILKIDREQRRISLGLKQTQPDPWDGVEQKWSVDEIVSGRITRLADFGAFCELAPGVEGLIPISEMSFERIRQPAQVVTEGQVVKVRVLNVDPIKKRISLSLKRVGDDPWMGASVRWPVGGTAEGRVSRIVEFGAFVELTPGVEGLVHISELAEGFIRSPGDVVAEGDSIRARVLEVDEPNRRISLSVKQLVTSPDYTGPEQNQPEQPAPQRKRRKPLKGGLD